MNEDKRLKVWAAMSEEDLACKFLSFSEDGPPDRFIRKPGGRIVFVELQDPKRGLSPKQVRRKKYLEALGFEVLVFYGTP